MSNIVYWRIYFPDLERLKLFQKDFRQISNKRGIEPLTDEESDIYQYCPIKLNNWTINHVSGTKIFITPMKKSQDFYADNIWIPFLSKYIRGELHIEDENGTQWGAKFDREGYTRLVSEIKMVEEDVQ